MHQVYCKNKADGAETISYLIMPRSMEMITTIEIIFKLLRVLVAFLLSLTTGSITWLILPSCFEAFSLFSDMLWKLWFID